MPGVLHIQRPHKHIQPAESQGASGRRLPGALRSEVGTRGYSDDVIVAHSFYFFHSLSVSIFVFAVGTFHEETQVSRVVPKHIYDINYKINRILKNVYA